MEHKDWIGQLTTGDSLREISRKTGISYSTVNVQLKNGTISAENVIAIAVAYGTHPVRALVDTGYLDEKYARSVDPMTALRSTPEDQLAEEILRRMKLGVTTEALTTDVNKMNFNSPQWWLNLSMDGLIIGVGTQNGQRGLYAKWGNEYRALSGISTQDDNGSVWPVRNSGLLRSLPGDFKRIPNHIIREALEYYRREISAEELLQFANIPIATAKPNLSSVSGAPATNNGWDDDGPAEEFDWNEPHVADSSIDESEARIERREGPID